MINHIHNEVPLTNRPLRTISRQSLVASTIEALRAQVADGTWRVGDRIPPEADIAQRLGVGRNTVREALRVLSHSEMLDVRQGDGTYVRREIDPAETMQRINQSDLRDHRDLQRILETESARYAAERRTKDDLIVLHKLLDARGESVPGSFFDEAFVKRDRAFHVAISAAAHNDALYALYTYFETSINVALRQVRLRPDVAEGDLADHDLAAHRAILDAIERQESQTAADAASAILGPTVTRLNFLLK